MTMPPPPGRFLLVQHHRHQRGFYDVVLDWVAVNLPDELWRFDLRELPVRLPRDGGHVAMIPWLQDPVEDWSMTAWHQAMALTGQCDAAGISVINRVERLAQAGKACGARLMASCGLRAARTVRIDDVAAFRRDLGGLPLPLFVREDLGHGGPMLRANTADELRALDLSKLRNPTAVELIDMPDPRDGLYRKYRYLVAGRLGMPLHLQITPNWVTRGGQRVFDDRTRDEELAYVNTPHAALAPLHAQLHAACQAMGLDFVAFDYGLDAQGRAVVWEANPFPYLHFAKRRMVYLNDAYHLSIVLMLALYYERAGLPLPERLAVWLARSPQVQPEVAAPANAADPGPFVTPQPGARGVESPGRQRARNLRNWLRRASWHLTQGIASRRSTSKRA